MHRTRTRYAHAHATCTCICTATAQPGETLVVPEAWWHYAASLTPSVTLMCVPRFDPAFSMCMHPKTASPHTPCIHVLHDYNRTPLTPPRCNFYDHSNVDGLRASFYSAAARALDETQRRARA